MPRDVNRAFSPSFDPVREIQRHKEENRRDDALDLPRKPEEAEKEYIERAVGVQDGGRSDEVLQGINGSNG